MSFKMPALGALVDEQLDIINLPTNRDWVIKGGPGTGKTVMAIVRAKQVSRYGKTVILVYNRPLKLFIDGAVNEANCEVKTYNEWISDAYRLYLGRDGFPHKSKYEPDYELIEQELMNVGEKYAHVIIDEAQDCPIELVRTVKGMSKNITCFIDPNQEVLNNKTNTLQLLETICIPAPYPLTKNFRNTKQIRNASMVFCLEGRPAMPFMQGPKPTMVKCDNYNEQEDYICDFVLNNRASTIGVIVDAFSLNKMYEKLEDRIGHIVPVQMFKSMRNVDFDFSLNGVQIFSYGTMKGLEFDSVIIARIDAVYNVNNDDKVNYNKLYVAATRACKELKITYFNENVNSKWIDAFAKINNDRNAFDWEEF